MSISYIIESIISGLLLGGIYALLSVGFGLTWGTMKVLNISHSVFAVLGAFVAYWFFVKLNRPYPVPTFARCCCSSGRGSGLQAGDPSRQKAKDVIMASMVATFGVAIVVENLMSYFWRPNPGS